VSAKKVHFFFPGQVEVLHLELEHVRALASPVRSLVFWTFSDRVPKSISDVAREVGRSPQSVRYHVNSLHDLGLILAVDTRKRRSRTEELYVQKGLSTYDRPPPVTPLYNRYRTRGFKLESRKMAKEMAYYYGYVEHNPGFIQRTLWHKGHLRLHPDDVKILREEIIEAFQRAERKQVPLDQGIEVNVINYIRPTMLQITRWAEELGVDREEFNRDDIGLDVEDEE
jgi:DNA-binding transcriptional ArsR family regulator